MSVIKKTIKTVQEHIQDIGKDIQKSPKDVKDFVRNSILRQPQTLRDYDITATLSQKELIDTLVWFHNNRITNIKNWIAERLLLTMDNYNFPIDIDNTEKLYESLIAIYDADVDNIKLQQILSKLSPQDIFSLQIYNYNSNFWNTHIKDGNKPRDLLLFKPHTSRPSIWFPKKPQREAYNSNEEYQNDIKIRSNEVKQRKKTPEYKKRNNRTEKTEWMKDILKAVLDMWPLNRLSNWIIKRISAVLERWVWAWVQHTIEAFFRPNILKMSPEEEEILRHILIDVKYGNKKYFIILNHETFANIPITIVKFMQVAHEMWIENINEHFTTIIWPLLATHRKQNALLNSLSSILVTHPADNKIQWAKRISNHQQKNAWSQLEKDLTKENEKWEIYFCAPSWTRDIIHYWENWVPQIFIPDESRWSNMTTARLIKNLISKNPDLRVYAVSTNTTELKKPNPKDWVSPNNNKRNKNATVSMHLQKLDTNDISAENMISTLLKWITYPIPSDEYHKPSKSWIKRQINKWKQYYDLNAFWLINEVQCAQPLPTEIFKYLKKFTKTPEYAQTWQLPHRFFDANWHLNLSAIENEIEENKSE